LKGGHYIEREMRETATGFHAVGLIDDATYRKITMRLLGKKTLPAARVPDEKD
jgi:hypothetical protein